MENKRNILVIISDFFEKYIINPLNKFWNIITFKSKKTFDDPSDAYHHRPLYWIYTLLLVIVLPRTIFYLLLSI